jgi:hypothetical protein
MVELSKKTTLLLLAFSLAASSAAATGLPLIAVAVVATPAA